MDIRAKVILDKDELERIIEDAISMGMQWGTGSVDAYTARRLARDAFVKELPARLQLFISGEE